MCNLYMASSCGGIFIGMSSGLILDTSEEHDLPKQQHTPTTAAIINSNISGWTAFFEDSLILHSPSDMVLVGLVRYA